MQRLVVVQRAIDHQRQSLQDLLSRLRLQMTPDLGQRQRHDLAPRRALVQVGCLRGGTAGMNRLRAGCLNRYQLNSP